MRPQGVDAGLCDSRARHWFQSAHGLAELPWRMGCETVAGRLQAAEGPPLFSWDCFGFERTGRGLGQDDVVLSGTKGSVGTGVGLCR